MTGSPRVSVLMSVYNGARYLQEAVDSILGQTFDDFEFIIVDDGSTDATPAILDSYTDARIVRLRNEANIGLTRSLNKGLAVARGEYVARQDADDVSLPERLQKQIEFLDVHTEIAALGTAYIEVPIDGRPERLIVMPHTAESICEHLFYSHCFCHGSVVLRHTCIVAIGGYDESYRVAQDRDLWLRLAERFSLGNLVEPLYRLHVSANSITGSARMQQRRSARRAVQQALLRHRLKPSAEAVARFYWLEVLDELADGKRESAKTVLTQGIAANPILDQDATWMARAIVYRAFDLIPISGRKRTDLAFDFLENLFALLPPNFRQLRSMRRWTFGELYAACAFMYARQGNANEVRHFCVQAWRFSAAHWRNLGLLSIFIRSWNMPESRLRRE